MTKTYTCPLHGEFEHECKISDEELKVCGQLNYENKDYKDFCKEKVTRVFKPIYYTECEGFCGRSYVNGK